MNAVHGLLDALGVADGEIVGAQLFAGGEGGQGAVRLLGGQALWNMVHLAVPKLADYRERITLYFDDAILELEFPSPYLNHQPTRLTIRTSDGHMLSSRGHPHRLRGSLRRGAERLLVGDRRGQAGAQHAEQARRDMKLLAGLARFHLAHDAQDRNDGGRAVKVRIGINPITWTNDDVPELGGDTPLETCLSETKQAGYAGTELGGKFPRRRSRAEADHAALRAGRDLRLVRRALRREGGRGRDGCDHCRICSC